MEKLRSLSSYFYFFITTNLKLAHFPFLSEELFPRQHLPNLLFSMILTSNIRIRGVVFRQIITANFSRKDLQGLLKIVREQIIYPQNLEGIELHAVPHYDSSLTPILNTRIKNSEI